MSSLDSSGCSSTNNKVVMARIGAPHGVKGDLKIQIFSEADLSAFSILWIQYPKNVGKPQQYPDFSGSPWQPMPAYKIFSKGQLDLIHFEGWNDRDLARKFTNALIGIDKAELPEISSDLEGHEFYWSTLIGMRVINLQGIDFGVVDHLFETGANDVLVTDKNNKKHKERLIPFVGAIVKSVDKNSRIITVDWDEDF
jgi:16S rRNA processing protein RimM